MQPHLRRILLAASPDFDGGADSNDRLIVERDAAIRPLADRSIGLAEALVRTAG